MRAAKTREEDTPSSLPAWPHGAWARIGHALLLAPRMPFVWFMRAYRLLVSPLYGRVCRYYPSCSKYALDAYEAKGAIAGTALTAWRLLRCNPFSRGGVDYVSGSVLARRSAALHGRDRTAGNGTIDRVPNA
ncbi:membrane protein insertion efficiency factor YidD [Brevibacterium rongguiense]|uniref:membrane protein insertion efficiency factor YidD n=1 Tax=Brevibacterium rongguiense TaxID=2695267 RepID=UPI00192664E9|nr:membrane protein insertion efficiency factor YidD [Brevibacterium rongguiense]